MTQLHRVQVADSGFTQAGVHYYVEHGTPMTVAGTPMVAIYGLLMPAAGWHAHESDAQREAADRIEALGRRLLTQAEALRTEAARQEATV